MFELKSDPTKFALHPYPVSDSDLVDPYATNPVYIGEWLALNNNAQLARAAGNLKSYVNYIPRGDTTAQITGQLTVITRGGYFARTRIYDSTGLVSSGQPLEVNNTVTVDGANKSGLILYAAGANYVVGHTIGLPQNGWLEFQAADPNRIV